MGTRVNTTIFVCTHLLCRLPLGGEVSRSPLVHYSTQIAYGNTLDNNLIHDFPTLLSKNKRRQRRYMHERRCLHETLERERKDTADKLELKTLVSVVSTSTYQDIINQ